MNPSVKTPKTQPHHRLTVKDVIRDYKAGLLTTRGAIFYLVASARKLGKVVRLSISWVCDQLGINKASYYRAIGKLSEQHRLEISAPDEMELNVPMSNSEGVPEYVFLEELSQICDSDSHKCDKNSQICDSDSQFCDSDSHLCDKNSQICDKKPPEPASHNGSGSPLSLQSLQSFSLSTESDRERDQNADAKQQIEPAYRDWLIWKSEQLPVRPTFLEQWVKKQAPLEANQQDFLISQNRQVETGQVPVAAAAPDLFEIRESCQRAIEFGDRTFVLERLQGLLASGWADLVRNLITDNQWHFLIDGNRILEEG